MRARPPRLAAGIAPPVHAGGRLLHHGIGHQAARSLATFRIRGSARWRCRCQRRRATPAPADRPAAVARHRHSEHRSQTSERSPLPATRSRRPPTSRRGCGACRRQHGHCLPRRAGLSADAWSLTEQTSWASSPQTRSNASPGGVEMPAVTCRAAGVACGRGL